MSEINYYKLHYELWERLESDFFNMYFYGDKIIADFSPVDIKKKVCLRIVKKYKTVIPKNYCFLCEQALLNSKGDKPCDVCLPCSLLFEPGNCLGNLYVIYAEEKNTYSLHLISEMIKNVVITTRLYKLEGEKI